jgi:hypothetical protein
VTVGNKTYKQHLKTKNYNLEEFIGICQAAKEGLLRDDWDGCEVYHHSESCNGGFLLIL